MHDKNIGVSYLDNHEEKAPRLHEEPFVQISVCLLDNTRMSSSLTLFLHNQQTGKRGNYAMETIFNSSSLH